jgi:outer membrane protein assembly factor BamB
MTYDKGAIFAGTGGNATVVAINATGGKLIWQSIPVGDPKMGYGTVSAPTLWKDIVIASQSISMEYIIMILGIWRLSCKR